MYTTYMYNMYCVYFIISLFKKKCIRVFLIFLIIFFDILKKILWIKFKY